MYHSDDPSHRYQNVCVTAHDVSDTPRDMQVFTVTPHVTSTFHPPGLYCPQDVQFADQFLDCEECNPGDYHGNVSSEEVPLEFKVPPEAGHKEILNKKVAAIELAENMGIAIHIKHPPIIIKGTLTTLQEEEIVVKVEVYKALPVGVSTTLIPLLVDMMAITVNLVVLMVVWQMICIAQLRKLSNV